MQIVTLYEREEPKEQFLTPELQRLYGGGLSFPEPRSNRPYVIGKDNRRSGLISPPRSLRWQGDKRRQR